MLNLVDVLRNLSKDGNLDPFSVAYICSRLSNEGIAFATKTLPKFGKMLLRAIELGHLPHRSEFSYFAWKGALPRVFRGLLLRIFDSKGAILPNPCPKALLSIRQVCEYFYKLSLPYTEDQVEEAIVSFIETDESLASPYDAQYVDQLRKDFETYYAPISRATIIDVFKSSRPRSGPGTFSGYSENYTPNTNLPWYNRKFVDYAAPRSFSGLGGLTKPIESAPMQKSDDDVSYSEVLFVPKDSRGPRTIVREPYGVLRFQMGFHDWIKYELEKATAKRVNFQDQQVNRDLARVSSCTREWATLDLSSASDRVSAKICEHVFRNSPAINYMIARRTRMTRLPNGKFLTLNKLSGMGSGLTFPLMSLLITLTITRLIVNRHRLPYAQARKLVFVYGDDIIVPTRYVKTAIDALELIKLKVGEEKSFSRGPFRESCGGDYLNGESVVPVRAKFANCELKVKKQTQLLIKGKLALLAVERHIRELVKADLQNTAAIYIEWLRKRVKDLPYVSGESPVLGIYVKDLPESWLPRDESGTFKTVKVRLPVPDTHEGPTNDYIYLANALKRTLGSNWLDGFVSGGSTYNEVSIPRSVKYKRASVSALLLLG